jgi:hypothetical protein
MMSVAGCSDHQWLGFDRFTHRDPRNGKHAVLEGALLQQAGVAYV